VTAGKTTRHIIKSEIVRYWQKGRGSSEERELTWVEALERPLREDKVQLRFAVQGEDSRGMEAKVS
jgi:hypothetical protein